eukprot:m.32022 g.32022  ORF g.32022 m.32022 type:complete len:572 (+) comp16568_c1_seq1:1635-3350(+)
MTTLSFLSNPLVALVMVVACVQASDVKEDTSLTYETFLSPAVNLKSGQIANTASTFGPFPMPKGKVAVRFFNSTVVDSTGAEVSESELYVHHYILFSNPDVINDKGPTHVGGFCSNLANVWGIGAELRGVTYYYPSPYAIILLGTETFGANLHFIRTSNVPQDLVQPCIECECPDSNPPLHNKGAVACCPDGDQCYGMQNSTLMDGKDYFLKYTVGYESVAEHHQDLTVFSMDATATHTDDCGIQYQVPALADGEIHTLQTMIDVNVNWTVVFMETHQHIGGVNMTVEHFRNGAVVGPDKFLCAPAARYGNGTEPGNELGYLVDIPTCVWNDGYNISAGDQLRITSYYSNRGLAGGKPWHSGVMALVYLAAVTSQTAKDRCLERLHYECGVPPYSYDCLGCAQNFEADLLEHGCTIPVVKAECSKTAGAGNIPAPDEVHSMSLQTIQRDTGTLINITAPVGGWFGVGFNNNAPAMNTTLAIIYSNGADGKPGLSARTLGPHTGGVVMAASLPANITVVDGLVNIQFLRTNAKLSSVNEGAGQQNPGCWLFAQGTTMDFGYHGSTRGFTCYN